MNKLHIIEQINNIYNQQLEEDTIISLILLYW